VDVDLLSRLLRVSGLAPGGTVLADMVFPNASNTGANLAGIPLLTVPAQATSGPGWTWNAGGNYVFCATAGATLSGLNIPAGAVYLKASGITLQNCFVGGCTPASSGTGVYVNGLAPSATIANCVIQTPGGGTGCIEFQPGSNYGTVTGCTISGTNSGAGRMSSGIAANNADPLLTITGCNVFWVKNMFENGQAPAGVCYVAITGNYLHDLGYVALDHSDCIYCSYGLGGIIAGNTLYNQLNQTDVIAPSAVNPVPLTFSGNLIAGAGYCLYGGEPSTHTVYSGPTQFFTFTGNYFSTVIWPKGGYYGPVINWGPLNNTWSGNYWFDGPSAGSLIAQPASTFTYQTPPAVPASGVPLANPFGTYCTVVVTAPAGCTLSAVSPTPNTALIPPAGATSQIMVPGASMTAGASITLTYTGTAPTWTWTT
jgi:hypothetical protein